MSIGALRESPILAHIRPARARRAAAAASRLDRLRAQAAGKRGLAARPVAVRRPEISARLQAIRLRQCRRAERRHGARRSRIGTFDNFNMVVAGVKGTLATGIDLIYDTLLVVGARRSLDRIRPARRSGQLSGRFLLGLLPAARGSEMARRQADDARGRDLFLRGLQEIQSAARRLLPPRRQGGEDRRPRDHLHLRRARAIANCRRSSASSPSCPSIGGRAPTRTASKRDIGATTLEPPLGSGPYRIKEFSPGRNIVYERVKDYWGKRPQRQCRPRQFRRAALRIFPRHHGRARGVQGRHRRLAHREQRQELGHRLRLPGGQRETRHPRGISDQQFRHDAGVRLQHPPRQVPGSAGAARLQLRVRFRGDEQADFLRPVQAHRQLFRGHRACVHRPAGRPRARNPGDGARQGAARGLHHALYQSGRRQSASRARQSARGGAAVQGSGLRSAQ